MEKKLRRHLICTELRKDQKENLEKISAATDLSVSQIVRKSIDEYLKRGTIEIAIQ